MKVTAVLFGCAMAAVLLASQSAASEQLLVHVTTSTADTSRFVVNGTGAPSTLVQAAAVQVRTGDDGTVTEITTPAVFSVPAAASFSIRVRALDNQPSLTLTVSGSSMRDADRIHVCGREIVLARHRVGDPVELIRADEVWSRPPANRVYMTDLHSLGTRGRRHNECGEADGQLVQA